VVRAPPGLLSFPTVLSRGDPPVRKGSRSLRTDEDFRHAYRALEARMRRLADEDGDVFLPNPEPVGPVDYVFVCVEPSVGRWARPEEQATSKVDAGFRNFVSSIEDFIVHFCIRRYLCAPGQRYHITDLSKGAMLVKRASVDRTVRYDRWYGLLREELALSRSRERDLSR